MSFLYPNFLYALVAVSIPVIIHLFNFRIYKTVYFSNIAFLQNVKQETKAKSQLKHLLVLLCRMLAVAAIVIAFAQPFMPVKETTTSIQSNVVSVYIDNSFSMEGVGKYGNLMEVAKNKAREIAEAYNMQTRFLLLTNDFEPKHQYIVDRRQFFEFINEVEVSPNTRKISEVVSRMQDLLKDKTHTEINGYLISDFQKWNTDIVNLSGDTTGNINLIPLQTQSVNNLYVDSCWFATPSRKLNQAEQLFVRIINQADEAYRNIPVKLLLNDSLKAIGSVNIEANASHTIELSYTNTQTGILNGKIEISDYPIVYDNTFYFNYAIAEKLHLLIIHPEKKPNKYLHALFSDDSYISVTETSENRIKTSDFAKNNAIILCELETLPSGLIQELTNYVASGGILLLFPGLEVDRSSYNSFLQTLKLNAITGEKVEDIQIQKINYKSEIYANVFRKIEEQIDLPFINKYYTFSNITRNNEIDILTAENGAKILSAGYFGKGKAYISAIPLHTDASTFVKHPLFVPTVYNIVLFSELSSQLYYTIGVDETIEIDTEIPSGEYNVFHIKDKGGDFDFIPQYSPSLVQGNIRLHLQQNIQEAGNYLITNNDTAITGIAFNYNRKESDLAFYTNNELKEMVSDVKGFNISLVDTDTPFLTKSIKELQQGNQYWRLFLMLALFFLAAEMAILRLWR